LQLLTMKSAALLASAALVAAAPHTPRAPAAGWSDKGCVANSASAPVLDTLAYQGAENSAAHCTKLCGDNMYTFAGLSSEWAAAPRLGSR
jgi:hypothetical protein